MTLRTHCLNLGGCLLLALSGVTVAQDDGRYPTPEQAPAFCKPVFITKPLDRAYPGIEYNIRPAVTGGTWPYRFALSAAPEGMKIDEHKGTITWQAPELEGPEVAVIVTVTDQAGRKAEQSFTIAVGKAGFVFVSPDGDDANPGTFEKPWKTVMRAAQPVTDPTNTTLYLRGGTYRVETPANQGKHDANVLGILRTSPRRWIAWPGEKPVVDLGWSEEQWKAALAAEQAEVDAKKKTVATTQEYGHRIYIDHQINDLLLDGLEVKNAAYYMFVMWEGNRERLTWRRCHLHHLWGDYRENPSFIFGFAPDAKWEPAAPGEVHPFGKRPQTKPYRHLVMQECAVTDRPYYTPLVGATHGGGLTLYYVQGGLIEDCLFERIEGISIMDKVSGMDNTYRNNVLRAAPGCHAPVIDVHAEGDGIDIHHNFFDGTISLGSQPGWIRNVWLHHNAIRGSVNLMWGGTRGPVEESIDTNTLARLKGPADPASQELLRGFPRDKRLIFIWANAIDVPEDPSAKHLKAMLTRIEKPFADSYRYVWWDGNLMSDGATVAVGWVWTNGVTWDEFKKACGFDVHGASDTVGFDADGRLPAGSPWRARFGRDASPTLEAAAGKAR